VDSPGPVTNRRILVIDDNVQIHEDFRKILTASDNGDVDLAAAERALFGDPATTRSRPSFELDFALQGEEGLERVRTALAAGRPYAMAFVDMRMPPGWDGLETIGRLWDVDPDLQVAICSAHSDYDWMDVIARLGHADKLLIIKKPFEIIEIIQCASALTRKWQNERILRRQVQTLEQAVSTHTEGLDIANRKLRHVATHDALTGLINRREFENRLTAAVENVRHDSGSRQALLYLDLDQFKLINDTCGHPAGDQLLRQITGLLQSRVRNGDTLARLGGDEFGILLASCSLDQALRVAEQLRQAIRDYRFIWQDGVLEVGASIGIVEITRESYRRVYAVNVEGLLFTLQAVAKQMIKQGRGGKIINFASQAGRRGEPLVAIYCSSKAAVISLTQSAGLNLIKHRINVNGIAPGVVDNEHWEHVDAMFAKYENLKPGEKKRIVGASVPFGRMARPDEIGGLATFLASEDAEYIVAQTYNIDGGNWMS